MSILFPVPQFEVVVYSNRRLIRVNSKSILSSENHIDRNGIAVSHEEEEHTVTKKQKTILEAPNRMRVPESSVLTVGFDTIPMDIVSPEIFDINFDTLKPVCHSTPLPALSSNESLISPTFMFRNKFSPEAVDRDSHVVEDGRRPSLEPTPVGPRHRRNIVHQVTLQQNSWFDLHRRELLGVIQPLVGAKTKRINSPENGPTCYSSEAARFITFPHGDEDTMGAESTLDDTSTRSRSSSDGRQESPAMSKFREQQSAQWDVRYRALRRYRKEYGHCLVPYNWPVDPSLAQWVKRQRYQYRLKTEGKKSTLTPRRESLLSELGFVWDTHEAAWEERRNELEKYKQMYGHCEVPCNHENQALAIWVKSQRRNNKLLETGYKSALTPERKRRLDEMDFVWNPPRGTRRRRGQQQKFP